MDVQGNHYRKVEEVNNKLDEIRKLSNQRRNDRLDGYLSVSDFYGGRYDTSDFVSPYTKSACNLDADVMLIAQDWSSEQSLLSFGYSEELALKGYSPQLPTNKRLQALLTNKLGIKFNQTYATNLFVFIKHGSISAKIKNRDLLYSAQTYTLPEISIVRPKIVICLGSAVYKVLSKSILGTERHLKTSVDYPFSYDNALIFGTYHPGGLGTAAAGGAEAVELHWQKIHDFYETSKQIPSICK